MPDFFNNNPKITTGIAIFLFTGLTGGTGWVIDKWWESYVQQQKETREVIKANTNAITWHTEILAVIPMIKEDVEDCERVNDSQWVEIRKNTSRMDKAGIE